MRHRKADLHRSVKGDLRLQFTATGLTSYAGLEVLRVYLQSSGLNDRLRRCLGPQLLGGDFRFVALIRLVVGMVVVGARRLRHVEFLQDDPMVERFAGLKLLPTARTLSRWLKRFRGSSVEALRQVNAEVVATALENHLSPRKLTIDVDGTVVSTGLQVERAFRGYNPHRRKVPSYYPITAHVGETGHVLRVQNRSGDINDGKASIGFLRDLFHQLSTTVDRRLDLRFRMDGDFFKQSVLELLDRRGAGYAIKMPFWSWLDLKSLITGRKQWERVDAEVDGFRTSLFLEPWQRDVQITIYRKRVRHESRKNYQLDLFDPDDGYWEYSAVASNLGMKIAALWHFMCGRGGHEKVIGELKSGLAFDSVPTNHYGANSAWQQLVVLAHNLLLNFQLETGAVRRQRSPKGTVLFLFRRAATLRFELFNRAGQLVRPHGVARLRMLANDRVEKVVAGMLVAMGKGSCVLTH